MEEVRKDKLNESTFWALADRLRKETESVNLDSSAELIREDRDRDDLADGAGELDP